MPKRLPHRTRIIEATLRGLAAALQQGIFAQDLSQRSGYFQSLDPRIKVLLAVELLICVGLSRNAWTIAAIYLVTLGIAWRSAIEPVTLIRRVWLLLPFFTLPIALPALFLTPGRFLLGFPLGFVITDTGAKTVLLLLLRVAASLTLSLLLIYTTAWNTVLSALTSLRLPGTFALILGMTHRYIFLLLRLAGDMFLSRQSRVVGRLSVADGQHVIAAVTAALLGKSLALSRDVQLAMQSRGFTGTLVTLRRFEMRPRDWMALGIWTLVAGAAVWLGR
jgi:cobalt/nickel transport system permease protein